MEKILLIRPGALGDTILTLPIVDAIIAVHSGSELWWLGTGAYKAPAPAPVLFRDFGSGEWLRLFDNSPEAGFAPWSKAYVALKRPSAVLEELRTCAAEIVSASTEPQPGRHIVESVAGGLGLPMPDRSARLARGGRKTRTLWLHPGSGGPRKCPAPALFTEILLRVPEFRDWEIVVTLGEADGFVKRSTGWDELMRMPNVAVHEGRPLTELMTRLGNSALFMGPDSGISHLAANLGAPAMVFFVDSDPAQWAPYVPLEDLLLVSVSKEQPSEEEVIRLTRRIAVFAESHGVFTP